MIINDESEFPLFLRDDLSWNDWEGRSTFEAVAGLLLCVNYSVNFFLLCAADSEIKRAADDALDRIRSAFCCCCNS